MRHKYIDNVAQLEIDVEKCVGCGRCADVCPHRVFAITNRKAEIKDKNSCIECGACAKNCPVSVISVVAGVGCAAAIITGWLTGSEPSCDCSGEGDCC